MVLKFRLISNEQDDFIRDFELLAEQTFFHFHLAIQDNLHYDKSQIASFFICNSNWEKGQEISLFELSEEESAKVITMDSAHLGDHVGEVHDKMIYVFDVFNERLFFIELVDKYRRDPSLKYPRCSLEKGKSPRQLLMDNLFGSSDLSDSALLDDLSYGNGSPELEGLDDIDFNLNAFEEDFPDEI